MKLHLLDAGSKLPDENVIQVEIKRRDQASAVVVRRLHRLVRLDAVELLGQTQPLLTDHLGLSRLSLGLKKERILSTRSSSA